MIRALKILHRYWYMTWVLLFFLLCYPLLYFMARKPYKTGMLNIMRRFIACMGSVFAGIFYRVHYEVPADWNRKYIICPNHASILDITAVIMLCRHNFSFMGKEELLNNPVTRLFFNTIDITVNRDSKMSSFRAFKRAGEVLAAGNSLAIFPEGKIGDEYPPLLHEFKNGPFRMAIEQQVPILPVTIKNSWKLCWDDGSEYGSKPGICDIWVHKAIETKDLSIDDADRLRDEVYAVMAKEITYNENRQSDHPEDRTFSQA